jgi:predicted nucleic acid-binding protein
MDVIKVSPVSGTRFHHATPAGDHLQRAHLRVSGDEWSAAVKAGVRNGRNGGHWWTVFLALVLAAAAICTVNALSMIHDAVRAGIEVPWWRPWVEEYSSLAGFIMALPLAAWVADFGCGSRPLGVRIATWIAGSAAFSLVHVGAMVGLRELVWLLASGDYSFHAADEWLYEYRKDLIAYALALAFFYISKSRAPQLQRSHSPDALPGRALLKDGARQVAVDTTTLSAACGGGNYVELIFADGRRQLLRSTVVSAELALSSRGFTRTHKRWLVRLASIEGMERTDAGDFKLRLAGGVEARLSRRRLEAVRRVRAALQSIALSN